MKRLCSLTLLPALLCFLILCGSCASSPAAEGELSFTDSEGCTVSLSSSPRRVAVLLSSLSDLWVTAGGEIAITVGESVERGFAGTEAVLVDGGAGKRIDNELLIASEPDLVICSSQIAAQRETVALLRESGIPAASFSEDGFEDYLDILRTFTLITGREELYEEYGSSLEARVEELIDDGKEQLSELSILFIRAGSDSSVTKAKTSADSFACGMLSELGTINIAEKAPLLLEGLSLEAILDSDPQVILLSPMGNEEAVHANMDATLASPEWQYLSAVRNGRVYWLPKELFQYKPNARWAEAYDYLIELLKGAE